MWLTRIVCVKLPFHSQRSMSDIALISPITQNQLKIYRGNRMKVTVEPVAVGVGVVSIGIALISAILILPGSKGSETPLLSTSVFSRLVCGHSCGSSL